MFVWVVRLAFHLKILPQPSIGHGNVGGLSVWNVLICFYRLFCSVKCLVQCGQGKDEWEVCEDQGADAEEDEGEECEAEVDEGVDEGVAEGVAEGAAWAWTIFKCTDM